GFEEKKPKPQMDADKHRSLQRESFAQRETSSLRTISGHPHPINAVFLSLSELQIQFPASSSLSLLPSVRKTEANEGRAALFNLSLGDCPQCSFGEACSLCSSVSICGFNLFSRA